MRLVFFSLSLLLFALCRYSYASVSWQTFTSVSSANEEKITKGAVEELKLAKDKILKLLDNLGNTFFGMALKFQGAYDNMPKEHFFKKSLANGILCEFADTKLSNKISQIMYGHDITEKEHTDEVAEAKAIGFDCDGDKKDDDCFCTAINPYNSFVFCRAKDMHDKVKGEGYTVQTCRDDAIAALKTKGTTTLGKAFDVNLVLKDDVSIDEESQIDKLVKKGADLLCDSLNTDVQQAVKAVYAADVLYWTIDMLIAQAIYGEEEKPLDQTCKELTEEAKKIPFAKCVCDLDKGVSFCYVYHAADLMKQSGFLNCDTKKFEDGKPKPKSLGIKESASKDGGSSNANQISLLAPLAAAAALLL